MLQMAREFSSLIPSNFSEKTADNDLINLFEIFLNYGYDLDIENEKFESFVDKFEPVEFNGDNFTQIIRWDLEDPLTTINFTYGLGMDVTGYVSWYASFGFGLILIARRGPDRTLHSRLLLRIL